MTFVVRNVFHCALGKRKKVRSSSPPSRRLVTTPGHRLVHARSKAAYAARAASACGRVDDAMEVVADLGERVLGRFTREIAKFVDAAALDGSPRPDEPDGASQPSIAVDDRQHRRSQPARDEIVEATLPCRKRLASAQLQGKQVL